MIEIIGSKNVEEQEMEWRSLPKNVRQIGETREKRRIYMEDYVVTYLGKLAKPGQAYARGAILFGNLYQTEEGPAVFVSGAVEAQNLELDMDETIFNEEIWKSLLEKGAKFFPGQHVMGWFLSRMGFSVEMNQKIINTHLKNFPGNHRILYMIDSLEKEDAIYLCENQQMIRQKGYYIYYEKNSAMQDYMLSEHPGKKESVEKEARSSAGKREQNIRREYGRKSHYRQRGKKQNTKIQLTRIASLLMILIMCAYIYSEMVERRWVDSSLKDYVVETMGTIQGVIDRQSQEQVEEEILDTVTTEGNTDAEIAEENTTAEETAETFVTEQSRKPMYYIVEKGDTLAAISRKMYMSDKYTKQIAWANSLDDEDEIYVGQKILIPSIE